MTGKDKEAMRLSRVALDIVKIHFSQNRHVQEALAALDEAMKEPVAFKVYEWVNPGDGKVLRSLKPDCHEMGRDADRVISVPAQQPVQEPRQPWNQAFEAWWLENHVAAHKIKSAQGFARRAWKAAISVAGATDSTAGFYPADGGSSPPRQAIQQPVQEPVYVRDEDNPSYMLTSLRLRDQQEPVAKVCHDLEGHIGWNPKLEQLPDEGTELYTAPQPRKPLTKEQQERAAALLDGFDSRIKTAEMNGDGYDAGYLKAMRTMFCELLAAAGITGDKT